VKEVKEVQDVEELSVILRMDFVGRGPDRAGIFGFNRDISEIPLGASESVWRHKNVCGSRLQP